MEPQKLVQLLETTTGDLSARLRKFPLDLTQDGVNVTGDLYHLAYRDGQATINELLDIAYHRIIISEDEKEIPGHKRDIKRP